MNAIEAEPLVNVVELDTGPGPRLRLGREAVNLSIEEVSARLHLDARTIANLEDDRYDQLPAPTFVRGYLRSYARLLNLPAQPIVDGFDRRGLEPPALIADISTSDETTSADAPMRIMTVAIVLVLAAGVMLWWKSEIGTEWLSGAPGDSSASNPPLTLEPTQPKLEPSEAPTESESLSLGVAQPAGTQEPARAPNPRAPENTTATTSPEQPLTATGPAVPPGVAHLVLQVRRESWVEIYDRDGERLYYSTGKAGDVIDVRGAEPIQALIGFADGVLVEYNGRPFDLSAHTTRGLARFKLGQ